MTDDYDQFTQRMTSFDLVLGEEDPSEDVVEEFVAHHGNQNMTLMVPSKEVEM